MTRRCIGLFLLSIAGAAQAQDGADLLSAYRRAESYLPRNIVELGSALGKYWRIESDTSISEVAPTHEDSRALTSDGTEQTFYARVRYLCRQPPQQVDAGE